MTYDPWRHRYTLLVAASTLVLLAAGGLVTSTGSGLAVPDWPLSFGQVMPPMRGGVLFEHGHRLVATTVGLLTIVLALWYQRRESRGAVRALSWGALAAVILQGLLGGLTVLLRLPPAVSVAHACLAQGFFALVVTLAVVTAPSWSARPAHAGTATARAFRPATIAAGAVFVQLALGAAMRHTGAGLAIPDFPLAFGSLVPPFASSAIALHFAHRVMAVVVTGLVAWTALVAGREPERHDVAIPARLAVALVLIQIGLGGAAVLSRLAVVPTTAHLVNGALLLAALIVTALRAGRAERTAERRVPSPVAARSPA
jgi:heme a synthase